jgi:hypothetical protein
MSCAVDLRAAEHRLVEPKLLCRAVEHLRLVRAPRDQPVQHAVHGTVQCGYSAVCAIREGNAAERAERPKGQTARKGTLQTRMHWHTDLAVCARLNVNRGRSSSARVSGASWGLTPPQLGRPQQQQGRGETTKLSPAGLQPMAFARTHSAGRIVTRHPASVTVVVFDACAITSHSSPRLKCTEREAPVLARNMADLLPDTGPSPRRSPDERVEVVPRCTGEDEVPNYRAGLHRDRPEADRAHVRDAVVDVPARSAATEDAADCGGEFWFP